MAALRPPGEQSRSFVQHFATGVVFAAVAGELLPEITKEHQPIAVVIGFALGLLTLLGLRRFTQTLEKVSQALPVRSSNGLLVTVALDGVLIGLGFATGEWVSTLLLVALTLELLFLGLSVAASLARGGASRGRVVGTVAGLALLVPLDSPARGAAHRLEALLTERGQSLPTPPNMPNMPNMPGMPGMPGMNH